MFTKWKNVSYMYYWNNNNNSTILSFLLNTFFGVSVKALSFASGPESSGILRIMFSSFGSSCMMAGDGIDDMFWNKNIYSSCK